MADAVEQTTPDTWGERFRENRALHVSFTERLARLCTDLLQGAEVEVAQLEHRTKDVDSFIDKIRRKNEKYEDPLREITDLTGIRIIAYYQEDVRQVGDLIEKEFEIDWANSMQYRQEDPERFGYRSDHYVISLSGDRLRLPEYAACTDLAAEIQVRTVMQHAWAAIDHKISYKASGLPPALRRRLSRLSALMETADEQFSMIRSESTELVASYREAIDAGELDLELNGLSLAGYLVSSDLARDWAQRASEIGFEPYALLSDEINAKMLVSPSSAAMEDLLEVLGQTGAQTIRDVDGIYAELDGWGRATLETILKVSTENGFTPFGVPEHVLAWLALVKHGDSDLAATTDFRDAIRLGIQAAIAE